jgi:membrane protein
MTITERLNRLDDDALPSWARLPIRVLRLVFTLLDQCGHDKLMIRASGLAYSTLLAIVPLVAVLFSLFAAFNALAIKEKAQEFLFSLLLPTLQTEIIEYVSHFTDNARTLGLVGSIVLLVTAILLLDNIESNFNEIWHVRSRRRVISKLTAYTSVLVFGTIFLGASVSVSAQIEAMIINGTRIDPGFFSSLYAWLFPFLLSLAAFLLMYQIIPHTRVRFRSALFGALTAGMMWEGGKYLFAASIGRSVRYSAIYGSIAVIPIFLIWLFITWLIILFGLEVTYTHQYRAALAGTHALAEKDLSGRLSLTLHLYLKISQSFHRGEPPPTADELAGLFSVSLVMVEEQVNLLAGAGLLRLVAGGNRNEGLVPSRSLGEIRVSDVIRAAFSDVAGRAAPEKGLERTADRVLGGFQSAGHGSLDGRTIAELVNGDAG